MTIEHIAIWVTDLEAMKEFYMKFFEVTANEKYFNSIKRFSSYFLSFSSGARIEIMHRPNISKTIENKKDELGFTHFAISVGSKEKVNQLTKSIRDHGYTVQGEPRTIFRSELYSFWSVN